MIDRRNVANLYALTPLQEGILFHLLRDGGSRAYHERLEFALDGPLDADAWRGAWQDLTDRHDMLRTIFVVRNTPRPLQVVLRKWPVALDYEDLSNQSPAQARLRIDAWKAADLERGFSPTTEVPMRLALFRLSPIEHRVVWSFNHLLLDGWCLAILEHEFAACYLARIDGRPAALAPAPRFADHVRWLASRDRDADTAFWRAMLDGFDQATPVPAGLSALAGHEPAPAHDAGTRSQSERTGTRGEHVVALELDANAALTALARAAGTTIGTVVQALWGLVLAGSHGTHDAVFATTVSGRPAEVPGADRTIGLFINAIPVRVRFEPGDTLQALLERLHEQSIAAQAHHTAPLPDIQAMHPLRAGLTDHVVVIENYPDAEPIAHPALPKVRAGDTDLHEHTHYDFEFQFLPATADGSPARLRFRFDAGRHPDEAVRRLGECFLALLRQAPDKPIDTVLAASFPNWRGPRRIALAASFTAEPIVDAAHAWLRRFGQPGRIALAPYNQCARALIEPDGALALADLALLVFRPEDALRDSDDAPADLRLARATAATEAMCDALAQWLARPARPPLVVLLAPSTVRTVHDPAIADGLDRLDRHWRAALRAAGDPALTIVDLSEPELVTGLPAPAWPDPAAWRLGHLPYTEPGCAALGAHLARCVLARSRAPFKVLAVDCDNTLWDGICGEAGPLGVTIGAPQQALQRFLIERQREGFLIVLASKNVEADVWAVFDRHPGMLLKREHLAGAAIDWQPKPENLRRLASELSLGLDSFIFIDDSPAEIAAVAHGCPEVLALQLPPPADLPRWLTLIWAVDRANVTDEDRQRTQMMRAEASRRAIHARSSGLDDFLAGIGLVLRIGPMAPHQRARMAQLTQRTNQFNLSGRRCDENQLAELAARPGTHVLALEVDDRFGAYGLTGVVIACEEAAGPQPASLRIDTLLLSCRVLGRRVEAGVLQALARLATTRGIERIFAPLVATPRNEPAQAFLRASPWQRLAADSTDAPDGVLYACTVSDALTDVPGITLNDGWQFTPPSPSDRNSDSESEGDGDSHRASDSDGVARPGSAKAAVARPRELPLPLVQSLPPDGSRHVREFLPMLAAASGWPWRLPALLDTDRPSRRIGTAGGQQDVRTPQDPVQQKLSTLWAEVLQCDEPVAIDAPFADLGGHSLHAIRVVSRIERDFGIRITLDDFLSLDTIEQLAAWLGDSGAKALSGQAIRADDVIGPGDTIRPGQSIPRLADDIDAPLSTAQQRLWLLTGLGNAPQAYNLCAAWRVRGALDAAALERAIAAVADRHEALRTRYPVIDDQPCQRIEGAASVRLQHAGDIAAAGLADAIAHAARQPFDLENAPPVRFALYRIAPDDHAVALFIHHVAIDGWSFGLLQADLARALNGEPLPSPPRLRYRDYAAWTRSSAFEQWVAEDGRYWQQKLGNGAIDAPIAGIPTDRARPPEPSGRGGQLRRSFPLPDRTALDRLLTDRRASPFQWLASLVALLLARHSPGFGGDGSALPVRLGTPIAGRDRPEFEATVGLFVNTLVLAGEVRPDESFETLLAGMRDTVVGALGHPRYPFDRLVEALAPRRDPSRNPLFDVMVVLQDAPREHPQVAGLVFEDLRVPVEQAAFDLVFEFADRGERIDLQLTWASDLYDPETVQRIAERFGHLIETTLAAPGQPLAELAWPGADEAAQLDRFASGPLRPMRGPGIVERIRALAARQPQALALATDDGGLNFSELAARAEKLACHLSAAGARPGARIATLLPRNLHWPVAVLAILRTGAIYLPLEPRHPPARHAEILDDAEPCLILAGPAEAARLGERAGCLVIDPATTFGNDPAPASAARTDASAIERPAIDDVAPPLPANDPAYLLYTSGSTGKPKGVLVSERAFVNMIDAQIDGFAIAAKDIVLQQASCAFDASLSELFMGLLAGAPVALADAATVDDPAALGRFLARHRVSVATFTPSYLQLLEARELGGLRALIVAGEAVRGRDVRRAGDLGIDVFNAYGPTETAVCASFGRVDPPVADDAPVPIGRPVANLRIVLRDAAGKPAPIGMPGELTVFGVGVALGYWRRPALNDQRFVIDPEFGRGYRTGDLARWRDDGSLEYLGRIDDMVKLRGLRIEPEEIAVRLRSLAGVRQAAVTIEAGPAGERLVAWLSPVGLDVALLRAALAAQLPAYMVPERWSCLPMLPLTTSGKLDRAALASADVFANLANPTDADLAERDRADPHSAERDRAGSKPAEPDPAAGKIAGIFARLLGMQALIDDDFFANGGNSLAAMQASRAIAQELGIECPAMLVFRYPSARLLAAALATRRTGHDRWNRWGNPAGQLVVALPPAPGLGAVYAPLAAQLPGWHLAAPDFDPARTAAEQIADWAAAIATENRPAILLGASAGGRLALALAERLITMGQAPAAVVLADTWRWRPDDPQLAEVLAELERRAEHDDRAALALAGLDWAEDSASLGSRYRRAIDALPEPPVMPIPVHHLLAQAPPTVPAGFDRDWGWLSPRQYQTHPMAGGHTGLFGGPGLAANAARIGALLDSILLDSAPLGPDRIAPERRQA